jgi:peptide/nickel transport system ATP-binding protein
MQNGDVVEQAATGDLIKAPREDYTRRLLGAVPRGYTGRQGTPRAI